MRNLSRRHLLKLGAASLAASALPCVATAERQTTGEGFLEPAPSPPFDFKYPAIGRIKPVASKEIEASPPGVGFETLDRMMFEPERAYEQVGRLGVKWARCQTGWARTEREPGQYDFAWLDDIANSLLGQGVWFGRRCSRRRTADGGELAAIGLSSPGNGSVRRTRMSPR